MTSPQAGDPRVWKAKRDFQIRFLRAHGLEPNHRLLDFGCGPLRGGIPIIRHLDEGNYVGLDCRDLRHDAAKEVRAAGLLHKRPRLAFGTGDWAIAFDSPFDVVWCFSVFIHMEDEDVVRFACRRWQKRATVYANVNLGERAELGRWRGMPVVQRPLFFYEQVFEGREVTDLGTLEELGDTSGHGTHQHMLRVDPV